MSARTETPQLALPTEGVANSRARARLRWWWLLLPLGALAWWLFGSKSTGPAAGDALVATTVVKRGDLVINVLEGGNIRAVSSLEIRSEVDSEQGGVKILSIIPEGYTITEDDIQKGKVLVELDKKAIKTKLVAQEIEVQTNIAALTEARENLAIQISENTSTARSARQNGRFARLDFEKFLGKESARQLLKQRGLPFDDASFDVFDKKLQDMDAQEVARQEKQGLDQNAEPLPAAASVLPPMPAMKAEDFLVYMDRVTDGSALQEIRKLQDAALVARNELALAEEEFKGSQKLAERNFITKSSLETEQANLEKLRVSVKSAETALGIHRSYDFAKAAESALSNCEEQLNSYARGLKQARAKLSQVEAKFSTAEQKYRISVTEKEDLDRQLASATIKAAKPGMVIYGGDEKGWGNEESIAEGATVRQRQILLTIPDMAKMALKVDVHESYVKRIRVGQRAIITVDAEPGRQLQGVVKEVAPVPDSGNSRYTSTKVYPTKVEIEGSHAWLRPGMSARAEIIISRLENVLYVPLQAVSQEDGAYVAFVRSGSGYEKRPVKVGAFSDQFIEIVSGLEENTAVSLNRPPGFNKPSGESGKPKLEEPAQAAAKA